MKIEYVFGLWENNELIDQTYLDENNVNLAHELFFTEFGYTECKHMDVYLIDEIEVEE